MRQYRPETIDADTLKKSYWLLGHIQQFKKNAVISVMCIEGFVIFLVLAQFTGYLYYALVRQEKVIDPLRASAERVGSPIVIPDPVIISYGAVPQVRGLYDLYALLKNDNQGWRADFDFIYSVNGVELPAQKTFLLPLEQKYALKTDVTAQELPQISYRIANLGWHRLSKSDVLALSDRSQFEIQGTQLLSGQGAQGGARLQFVLKNNSTYKFWDFRVPIVLKQGNTISAVALIPIFSIDRNEKKRLEVQWEYPVNASAFEIIPDIDILNPSTLRPAL